MSSVHPGKTLLEQYLTPHSLSQNRLARLIGVPPRRINEIVLGKRAITADTALRLSEVFGNSAGYWMHLQAQYDIQRARDAIGAQLARIQPLGTAAPRVAAVPRPRRQRQIRRRMMR